MTKLSDFPVYGLAEFDDKSEIPVSLEYQNYATLLIEFTYERAEETLKNLTAMAQAQGLGNNYSSQIGIVKLFNIGEIQSFRRSYDWHSQNESVGYSQLIFTKTNGNIIISEWKYNFWRDEESLLAYG